MAVEGCGPVDDIDQGLAVLLEAAEPLEQLWSKAEMKSLLGFTQEALEDGKKEALVTIPQATSLESSMARSVPCRSPFQCRKVETCLG